MEVELQVTTSNHVRRWKVGRIVCPADCDLLGTSWLRRVGETSSRSGDGSWAGRLNRLYPLLQDNPPRLPNQLSQEDNLDLVV